MKRGWSELDDRVAMSRSRVSNVLLSFVFVRYLGLSLRGIVFGTLIAVIVRCAIWMPWYVLRELKRSN